jgi:hypothetical protein
LSPTSLKGISRNKGIQAYLPWGGCCDAQIETIELDFFAGCNAACIFTGNFHPVMAAPTLSNFQGVLAYASGTLLTSGQHLPVIV